MKGPGPRTYLEDGAFIASLRASSLELRGRMRGKSANRIVRVVKERCERALGFEVIGGFAGGFLPKYHYQSWGSIRDWDQVLTCESF